MKKIILYYLLLILSIMSIPLVFAKNVNPIEGKVDTTENLAPSVEGSGEPKKIDVYDIVEMKIVHMNMEDYVLGVLAAEMPSSFHIEALKAQALAARTYAVNKLKKGEALCTDYKHCQAYKDPSQIIKDKDKLSLAIKETEGQIIVDRGEPIIAAFHSTSGGKTENVIDLWGGQQSYLVSVDSEYEEAAPKLSTVVTYSNEEIKKILETDDYKIKILEYTNTKRVKLLKVGDKTFSGSKVREKLKLNSNQFSVLQDNKSTIFHVVGYGHGIGMSQYGANGMGEKGYTYEQIIKHYYQGVEILLY